MKKIEHEVSRNGDRVVIKGLFRDRMKRPGSVSIKTETHTEQMSRQIIEGDVHDVSNTMFALAQIAWDMGWRPVGLGATLAATVERFKLPKPE